MAEGQVVDPLMAKLNEKHIDKILQIAEQDNKLNHDKKKEGQRLNLVYAIVGTLGAIFVCWLFLWFGKSDQVDKFIAGLFGFLGGLGVGKMFQHFQVGVSRFGTEADWPRLHPKFFTSP